jgi:hypothetical protein
MQDSKLVGYVAADKRLINIAVTSIVSIVAHSLKQALIASSLLRPNVMNTTNSLVSSIGVYRTVVL